MGPSSPSFGVKIPQRIWMKAPPSPSWMVEFFLRKFKIHLDSKLYLLSCDETLGMREKWQPHFFPPWMVIQIQGHDAVLHPWFLMFIGGIQKAKLRNEKTSEEIREHLHELGTQLSLLSRAQWHKAKWPFGFTPFLIISTHFLFLEMKGSSKNSQELRRVSNIPCQTNHSPWKDKWGLLDHNILAKKPIRSAALNWRSSCASCITLSIITMSFCTPAQLELSLAWVALGLPVSCPDERDIAKGSAMYPFWWYCHCKHVSFQNSCWSRLLAYCDTLRQHQSHLGSGNWPSRLRFFAHDSPRSTCKRASTLFFCY